MRKLLMLVTMLLVPALASAWTVPVKVTNTTAGIAAGNGATVSYTGFAATEVEVGTRYFYPASTVASVNVDVANSENVTSITLDNVAQPINASGITTVVIPQKSLSSLKVVYATAATTPKCDITLNQTAGGLASLSIGKSSTTVGYTGVAVGTSVTVKAQPNIGFNLVGVSLNGAPLVSPYTFVVADTTTDVVTATFAQAPVITASVSLPSTGVIGTPVVATATASSTGAAALHYAWTVNGAAVGSDVNTYSLTPVAGVNNVSVTVSSADAASVIASASLTGNLAVDNYACTSCHAGSSPAIVAAYNGSVHSGSQHSACSACHSSTPHSTGVVNATNVNPASFIVMTTSVTAELYGDRTVTKGNVFCTACHNGAYAIPHAVPVQNWTCNQCHTPSGAGDAHSISATLKEVGGCVDCHAVAQPASAGHVNDNNGVRSITNEFSKWSHHVTGVQLQNAHCAACHLEGKASNGQIVIDSTYHMADAKTHLRNADTDADMAWDPAAPSHSTMDNFCMSCHDANGATSTGSLAIQALIVPATGKTASPSNPFGDTISNQYDMEERPAVVNAAGQFATGNNSHHAVVGKKYTGRTRGDGIAPRTVDTVAFAANSSATLPGKRSTIFDAGKFQADYTTLADAAGETDVAGSLSGRNGGTTLGDDSTLHCGDCHTVGQFRAADAAPGNRYNKAVIGAHGSNNEYLLRNNVGTDARHQGAETVIAGGNADNGTYGTKPFLVCFNCHAFTTYGTITSNNGETGKNHAGEYTKDERCNGPYNTVFTNMTGETRLKSMVTATGVTGATGYGNWAGGGKYYGNMFGIQCANCHNSGVKGNLFGGIHGSGTDQTYIDGMGNTSKHFRFLPGLGNAMYAPGVKGGFVGGTLATYKSYSGSRDGSNTTATGAAFGTANQTFKLLPVRTIKNTAAGENSRGSYQYITGGVSNDLNWEQRTQQPIKGEVDLQSQAMGCYTITPEAGNYTYNTGAATAAAFNASVSSAPAGQQKNPKVLYPTVLQTGTGNVEDIRNAATTGLTAGDGREVFDVWGGCDDHNGAQGAGTGAVRKVLRKVTY